MYASAHPVEQLPSGVSAPVGGGASGLGASLRYLVDHGVPFDDVNVGLVGLPCTGVSVVDRGDSERGGCVWGQVGRFVCQGAKG